MRVRNWERAKQQHANTIIRLISWIHGVTEKFRSLTSFSHTSTRVCVLPLSLNRSICRETCNDRGLFVLKFHDFRRSVWRQFAGTRWGFWQPIRSVCHHWCLCRNSLVWLLLVSHRFWWKLLWAPPVPPGRSACWQPFWWPESASGTWNPHRTKCHPRSAAQKRRNSSLDVVKPRATTRFSLLWAYDFLPLRRFLPAAEAFLCSSAL